MSLMLHTVKRISHISGRFAVWKAPKSGLGRHSASPPYPKDSGPAQTQGKASGRPDPQNGNRSDAQVKADTIHVPSLLWYQRLGPATRFFGWYDRTQTKNPYMTQLFSSLLIYLFGDQLAQGVGGEPYDGKRTLRHITIGAIMSLPGYRWFMFLGSHFNYSSKILSLAIKVVVNQVLFSPVLNVYFFGMQAVLSGDDTRGVVQRIRGAVPESIVNSLKFWPAVTALTFAFIQPRYRFLFSGGFATLWQTYLSYLNRREEVRIRATAEELAVEHEAQMSGETSDHTIWYFGLPRRPRSTRDGRPVVEDLSLPADF